MGVATWAFQKKDMATAGADEGRSKRVVAEVVGGWPHQDKKTRLSLTKVKQRAEEWGGWSKECRKGIRSERSVHEGRSEDRGQDVTRADGQVLSCSRRKISGCMRAACG